MMKELLVLSLFLVAAYSHVCLLAPFQRGTANNINTAGTSDCFFINGPCGGKAPQEPKVVLLSGSNFTVVFQKNLNHWTSAQPGEFRITYEQFGHTGSFRVLKTVPDTNTPSLTLFTETVTLPDREHNHIVIGVQYVAPSAGHTFYQCADAELRRFV
eukprot:TRINITY_DN10324_c0_g1_i2.p1 TRINITY_DN10324_c0_g1~~TRINITY_DN10324_c0_g1_i2.p1  ORF type:complete len:157 (-),score=31.55 TRINITY_DN10324_c0_g1_i2:66-536(-)